jgi:hypothetical protein
LKENLTKNYKKISQKFAEKFQTFLEKVDENSIEFFEDFYLLDAKPTRPKT